MTTPTPTRTHPHTINTTVPPSHIQTFTGRHINPFDPDPDAIDIEDIAHALSHICRFTGHTHTFYSVAQHSVHVADLVCRNTAGLAKPARSRAVLMALLHDASEAYLCDIPRPLKPHVYVQPILEMAATTRGNLCRYHDAEGSLQVMIYRRFGLTSEEISEHTPAIHEADMILLATERRDLLTPTTAIWPELEHLTPLADQLYPQVPSVAKDNFMDAFGRLTQELR